MKTAAIIKTTLWTLGAAAAVIQFARPERSNPEVTREVRWDSEATAQLVERSCYDCHSNETAWPWYSSVAPVSWLVARDVAGGREHLNFSTWDEPNHGLDEMIQMVEDGEMPPKPYLLLHPEARLDDEERAALLSGLEATLAADPPVAEDDGEEEEHSHD